MNESPHRRKAIVTGAASGLGRALALRLAADGWHLALADRNLVGCRETAALVEQAGGTAQVESLDVSRPEDWTALVERLQAEWVALDLLINNAGVATAGEVAELSLDDWRWTLDVNLLGTIYGCRACCEWLLRNPRGGHIVNIASAAAFYCVPTMAAYNVSKAGVVALSETLYAELHGRGLGVTVACPGFFSTNLLSNGRFHRSEQRAAAEKLMRRSGLSADVVAAAIVKAIARKKLYVVLGWQARLFWRLRRWMPVRMAKLISKVYERQRRPPKAPPAPPTTKAEVEAAGR